MDDRPRLVISAGEASGDHHAARVVRALSQRGIEPHLAGMGGPHLAAAGMDIRVDCRDMAIVGIIEVIRHWRRLRRQLDLLRQLLRDERPDLLILVDYPDFNLRLAATAGELGIPVLYYISPQLWAWRPGRVHRIRQLVDMMAVVFPFEADFYARAGVPVRYVGHPLVDDVRPTAPAAEIRAEFGLSGPGPVVGLLPGSRDSEVRRMLPLLLRTAAEIRRRRDDAVFILPVASTLKAIDIQATVDQARADIRVVDGGRAYDVLSVCDAAVAVSGTVTLEAALLRVPMAVVYRVNWLTFQILRRLVSIRRIALVNIVAGRSVIEEFIQHDADPGRIADETVRLLDDAQYRQRVLAGLDEVRELMGESGGPGRAADLIMEMLASRRHGSATSSR